jgi:CSLREA domain-containing protein
MNRTRLASGAVAVLAAGLLALGGSGAHGAPACNLVPQLRDITVNQGLGSYSPLEYGKETLVRAYLSMPSCAGSSASIQVTNATLTVTGANVASPIGMMPTPSSSAYPAIATFSVAPVADSTGDPRFVVPGPGLTNTTGAAFTATFTASVSYQVKASKTATPVAGTASFTKLPTSLTDPTPSANPIRASVDKRTTPFHILVVPMGDASKLYSTQFSDTAQAAVQDGMTATLSRVLPVAAGVGNLGSTAGEGLQYTINPTVLPLNTMIDRTTGKALIGDPTTTYAGKFCGTGASYDALKGQLYQMLRSWQTANPAIQVDAVLGVIDPAIAAGPPNPCFEGMGQLGSAEAWAQAISGRAGQIMGVETLHTLAVVPPDRASPFDAGHSQNTTAENPSLNRRYNVVQRAFVTTDRSLMKPAATSPSPDNSNTLLEAPDFAYVRCLLGGTANTECTTYPKTLGTITSATLAYVMSGSTDGTASGTNVVESYFASSTSLTPPDPASQYVLRQKTPNGNIDRGVPVNFVASEHAGGSHSDAGPVGLFSIAQVFDPSATRIEFWKGTPGSSGSVLLYARDRNEPPMVTGMTAGAPPILFASNRQRSTGSVRAPEPAVATTRRSAAARQPIPASPPAALSPVGTFDLLPRAARILFDPSRRLLVADGATRSSAGTTYTVNTAADHDDGTCNAADCSLREAIKAANAHANSGGPDTIDFAIAGTGPQQISVLSSALPAITDAVVIDGDSERTTATDLSGVDRAISLSGDGAGLGSKGLVLAAGSGGSEIKGLAIRDFDAYGIHVQSDGNTVDGNYIGLRPAGDIVAANGGGILIEGAGNTIGGDQDVGNLIVGPLSVEVLHAGSGNVIAGNEVGLDVNGVVYNSPNPDIHVQGTTGTVIGDTVSPPGNANRDRGNVLAGSQDAGIFLEAGANQTIVAGNFVGTDRADAATTLGNADGIRTSASTSNNIGPENTIAWNTSDGVDQGSLGNRVVANSIHDNAFHGIFNSDSFTFPGPPTLTAAAKPTSNTTITGTYSGAPNSHFFIELFQNSTCDATGEGTNYFGYADAFTDANGNAKFSTVSSVPNLGDEITATATDATTDYSTSIFSQCITVTAADPVQSSPLTVNTTDDHDDGFCTLTDCTLREAINAANGTHDAVIDFGILSGPQTIQPASPLPAVTAPVTIDGTTQPGFDAGTHKPIIELDGSVAATSGSGLELSGGNSTVRGLVINRFDGSGIVLDTLGGDTIGGNYIGLDAAGTGAAGNGLDGVQVDVSANAIGGTTAAARNVISGNGQDGIGISGTGATGNVVRGNLIGTNAASAAAVPNGGAGVTVTGGTSGNALGGATLGAGNVISGNTRSGIELLDAGTAGNAIQGNYIGLNAAGTAKIGNSFYGILVEGTGSNTIGGTTVAAGNVIAGNASGVVIGNGQVAGQTVQGNAIGTAPDRTTVLGELGAGVAISNSSGNVIGGTALGAGNVIAGHTDVGVLIDPFGGTATGNAIRGNSIHGNVDPNIDLAPRGITANDSGDSDAGANNLQNFPVISDARASSISGTINSNANTVEQLDFYSNPACSGSTREGAVYLGSTSITTGVTGNASFTFVPSGLSAGAGVTATATDPAGNTSEFSACVTVNSAAQGQEPVSVTVGDDNPSDDRVDLFLDCGAGKPKLPVAVGLKPDSVGPTSASFSYNYDPSLACPGGTLRAVGTDGFTRTGFTQTGSAPVDPGPNDVRVAISSPLEGAQFLTYSLIPLRGSARNSAGELPDSGLQWSLSGPNGLTRTGAGHQVDLSPNTNTGGKWPSGALGSYTITLTATAAGKSASASVHVVVKTDADNDGIPADAETCIAGGDSDPLNAFGDADGDGIPNQSDPQPCTPATSYTANEDFNPDPLPLTSTGSPVTVYIRLPSRNLAQIRPSSVRITAIAGEDVSSDSRFANTAWSVSGGVGTAKFDRQKLFQYLTENGIHNRVISISVTGSSSTSPQWSFDGFDTTFVQG